MHRFAKSLIGAAATAALGAVLVTGTADLGRAQAQAGQPAAQSEKKPKDTAEYEMINEVIKDLQGTNPQKTITDLNNWAQKYPESDYKDERQFYYMQAYTKTAPPQPDKIAEHGATLLAKDLKAAFKEQAMVLQVLYLLASTAPTIPNPTPEQLDIAAKAGKQLQAFAADPANKPANVNDAQWAEAKTTLNAAASAAMSFAILGPGNLAMQKKDYPAAEQAFRKALPNNPDNGMLAYLLGSAIYSQKDINKIPDALYFIARGAAMDPAKGGIADATTRTQIDAFLRKAYTSFHGSDEGLDQIKQQALNSPMPPAGFKIKTAQEVATEKQQQFAAQYPQLALWMGIKSQLAAPEGEQYFQTQMKDAAVPKLKGIITGGECRGREILVAVPEPNQTSTPQPEIALKLEASMKGKPVAGTEIQWEGVPTAFTKDPFMLTMDTEQAKIEGLKTETCTPAKKAPAKSKATTKKK